ncbi:hypothetical protein WA026_020776 [Henosepilachna vigintioctopunctata]|uniref:Uncharacterized protein n=1 Tax=Henosepilachna vigintioctopunctata TaxID=420089 RepID=A0AAW1TRS7_9CUCU
MVIVKSGYIKNVLTYQMRNLQEVGCTRENYEQNKINEEASYANALKRKNKEELLIINCEEQNNPKKLEELKSKINPTELKIGQKRCRYIKKEVEEKMGRQYRVTIPNKKNPRIKIVGLEEKLNEDKLKESIHKQNGHLCRDDTKIVITTYIKEKLKQHVLEATHMSYNGQESLIDLVITNCSKISCDVIKQQVFNNHSLIRIGINAEHNERMVSFNCRKKICDVKHFKYLLSNMGYNYRLYDLDSGYNMFYENMLGIIDIVSPKINISQAIDRNKKDSKTMWKTIKNIISKKQTEAYNQVEFNGIVFEDINNITQKFNNCFVDSIKEIMQSIPLRDNDLEIGNVVEFQEFELIK